MALTGYALRWDQDGFWATVVSIKVGSYSPFVGSLVTNFLLGGDVTGPATLSRFFALHVWVLPAAIAPLSEPANTATVDYVPRPEWFFFFYEQMLMFFPGYALTSFAAVVVPTIFIVLLYAVPWLDSQPGHDALSRPFATVVGLLVVGVVVLNMMLAVSRVVNFLGG